MQTITLEENSLETTNKLKNMEILLNSLNLEKQDSDEIKITLNILSYPVDMDLSIKHNRLRTEVIRQLLMLYGSFQKYLGFPALLPHFNEQTYAQINDVEGKIKFVNEFQKECMTKLRTGIEKSIISAFEKAMKKSINWEELKQAGEKFGKIIEKYEGALTQSETLDLHSKYVNHKLNLKRERQSTIFHVLTY